jgi:hypothetical protein
MTPRAGVKTTPAIETRLLGPPDPKRGPLFGNLAAKPQTPCSALVYSAGGGDTCVPQHMSHLRFAQAGSVIFK